MGQILIRNLEDAVIADYREAEERNQRSLEAEVREALKRAKPISMKMKAEMIARAAEIRAMTPKGVPQTPAEILVREDRDGNRG